MRYIHSTKKSRIVIHSFEDALWPFLYDFVQKIRCLISIENFYVNVTQINYVSRNQLHNTANGCQILNFGWTWPG